MIPDFDKMTIKHKVRERNIGIYRKLSGLQSLPKDKQYWTLCATQSRNPKSEIEQMTSLGFIEKYQFHGVDRDEEIIKQNRKNHTEAHWYAGEWESFINPKIFNPAFVYLDTTAFADFRVATNLLVTTMLGCPEYTLLLVNVMLNDPRSRKSFSLQNLIESLNKELPASFLKKWNNHNHNKLEIDTYDYTATSRTIMGTCIFFRNGN